MMQARAELQSYEELEFSITLTAPVSDWRAMLKLLAEMNNGSGRYGYGWPLSGFVESVKNMLHDLDKTHAAYVAKEGEKS